MRPWETFFNNRISEIFLQKKSIVDIGGGLRILKNKNNRYDPSREWIHSYLDKVDYKILDVVDDYHPDIVGDIHNLPFDDNSQDAFICIAVLQHVKNPTQATLELYRTLKPGGYCFVYVPFLYYYHAQKGYYSDYWRFTTDAINNLFESFSSIEIQAVRGAIETWLHLSPLGTLKIVSNLGYFLDKIFGKLESKQVSGYYIFLVK
jgi:SAM-dependent methyltransferase